MPGYRGRIERAVILTVEAADWNCPQHITPRYTEQEWSVREQDQHQQIEALQAEVEHLRTAAMAS